MYNKDFYNFETVRKILQTEERKGHLKHWSYSDCVMQKSKDLKEKRKEIKGKPKLKREELLQELKELQTEYDDLKKEEQKKISDDIINGKYGVKVHKIEVKNHDAYATRDIQSFVVSRIITQELKTKYKVIPADRNRIIEQLYVLLDNQMPKTVIRCDVKSFYESIPQQGLMTLFDNDGLLSRKSYKYLKKFLYEYNSLSNNNDAIGMPRGLSFSAYLSEIFMKSIDKKISQIDGVFFYKRYVDDIIVVANPKIKSVEEYWKCIDECFENTGLSLHEDSEKMFRHCIDSSTNINYDYLGYGFYFEDGKLSIRLSQSRFNKYKCLIDLIFETYEKCSHYRKIKQTKNDKDKKKDALKQLYERLNVLTGNGLLSGRKNYVATGIYYSNRFITDTSQLKELDIYLSEHIDNPEYFCPPSNLFKFNGVMQHSHVVETVKEKLHRFSFVKSFNQPVLHKNMRYSYILHNLQKIYYYHYE